MLEAERDTALLEAALLKVEVEGLQNEALNQYLEGFSMALAHVQMLYPKADLSSYGPFKEIVEGQLKDSDEEGPIMQEGVQEAGGQLRGAASSPIKPQLLPSLISLPLTSSIAF